MHFIVLSVLGVIRICTWFLRCRGKALTFFYPSDEWQKINKTPKNLNTFVNNLLWCLFFPGHLGPAFSSLLSLLLPHTQKDFKKTQTFVRRFFCFVLRFYLFFESREGRERDIGWNLQPRPAPWARIRLATFHFAAGVPDPTPWVGCSPWGTTSQLHAPDSGVSGERFSKKSLIQNHFQICHILGQPVWGLFFPSPLPPPERK